MRDGESFGELAILNGDPRAATIISTAQPCHLVMLGKKDYDTIFGAKEREILDRKLRVISAVPAFHHLSR